VQLPASLFVMRVTTTAVMNQGRAECNSV
jgi:hypothetical protein